jgi:hypothetical protein
MLDRPMTDPRILTHHTRNREQTYRLIALKPHINRFSVPSRYTVSRTTCRVCGQLFCTTSAASKRALAVHCPVHLRKNGRERGR